jgi:hypothetical protein
MVELRFEADVMKYFLLNILVHDYLHDVSPNTGIGKTRIVDTLTMLSREPVFPDINTILNDYRGRQNGGMDSSTPRKVTVENTATPGSAVTTQATESQIGSPLSQIGSPPSQIGSPPSQIGSPPSQIGSPPSQSLPGTASQPSTQFDSLISIIQEEAQRVMLCLFGYIQLNFTSEIENSNRETRNDTTFYFLVRDMIMQAFRLYYRDLNDMLNAEITNTIDKDDKMIEGIYYEYFILKILEKKMLDDSFYNANRFEYPHEYFNEDYMIEYLENIFVILSKIFDKPAYISHSTDMNSLSLFYSSNLTIFQQEYNRQFNPPRPRAQSLQTGGAFTYETCMTLKERITGEDIYNFFNEYNLTGLQGFTTDANIINDFIQQSMNDIEMNENDIENLRITIAQFRFPERTGRTEPVDIMKKNMKEILENYYKNKCKGIEAEHRKIQMQIDEARRQQEALDRANQGDAAFPQDLEKFWRIGKIYSMHGLIQLGICDLNGAYRLPPPPSNTLLRLEADILHDIGWSNRLTGIDLDRRLELGIRNIYNSPQYTNRLIYSGGIAANNSYIAHNSVLTNFRQRLGQYSSFLDNACQGRPNLFGNFWPETMCKVSSLMDGWGGSGCVLKPSEQIKDNMLISSFNFKLTDGQVNEQFFESVVNVTQQGNVSINTITSFSTGVTQAGTDFLNYFVNTSIYDKKTLSAKNVLRNQIAHLITCFNEYLDIIKNAYTTNAAGGPILQNLDLWLWLRTDNDKMKRLMELGAPKSFADLAQEIEGVSNQNALYFGEMRTGDRVQKINGARDVPLVDIGTDRPSGVGRAAMFVLNATNPGESLNNLVIAGYSTNQDNYFLTLPLDVTLTDKSTGKSKEISKIDSNNSGTNAIHPSTPERESKKIDKKPTPDRMKTGHFHSKKTLKTKLRHQRFTKKRRQKSKSKTRKSRTRKAR